MKEEEKEIYKKLSAPFETIAADSKTYPAHKWRIQSGKRCIPYIDARQVSERLNEVLGVDGWENTIEETNQKMLISNLTCIINGKEVSHSDVGTGGSIEKEKAMASDSLKRAAVHFGIGRYLYDMEPVTVPSNTSSDILKSPDKLSSYINQLHPMRSKLTEIYKALGEDAKSVDEEFKKIWKAFKI